MNTKETAATADAKAWFVHDRFGMFIHWGLFTLYGKDCWVNKEITAGRYDRFFRSFNMDLYDPGAIARAARAAGMRYVVPIVKHHEGFCFWDTKYTDYKVTNTPYGKDMIGPLAEAVRAEGLRFGIYYSLLDWHHPEITIDAMHPLRDAPDVRDLNARRDMNRYVDYMGNQLEELLTRYGPIAYLFFDYSYKGSAEFLKSKGFHGKGREEWQSERLIALARRLQPGILINNRADVPQDFYTPEQIMPTEWLQVHGQRVTWEANHTMNGGWGYLQEGGQWKSPEQLIQLLVDAVANGGNLIMNVGPTGRGLLDRRTLAVLETYGEWMQLHGRAIYGCTTSEFEAPRNGRYTQNGNRLYLHIYNWPFRHLHLPGLKGRVEYAQFLHDGTEVTWEELPTEGVHQDMLLNSRPDTLTLRLPVRKPDVVVPVIELFLS